MNDHSTNVFQDMVNSIGAFVQVNHRSRVTSVPWMASKIENEQIIDFDKQYKST
jgi:hypothetical protein